MDRPAVDDRAGAVEGDADLAKPDADNELLVDQRTALLKLNSGAAVRTGGDDG
ncbi:MAG TPA: hypothetical protein VMB34_26275 [Acetobacteraceae bacterium]|nr:hypothetical protein [Acetobacteraceae bacterium]